jgi:serine/threonine-protein kinase
MGAIYAGVRLADDADVAVKVMRPRLATDPELVRRFEREIEATSRIEHENVVGVVDHGQTGDGVLYLVMELLVGRTLDVIIVTEAPLAPRRVAGMGQQIAAGLGAAHAADVVHRDLKPENVIVRRDHLGQDRLKVYDFGLSFPSGNDKGDSRITAVELRLGTPAFMAPEYIRFGAFDERSDLYALGVMLYECCCGHTPFEGPSYKLMHQHLNAPPPPLAERCAAPGWLTELIMELLAKDPDDRPQSADEVRSLLQREGGPAGPR